jgi:WD40 repeat protein
MAIASIPFQQNSPLFHMPSEILTKITADTSPQVLDTLLCTCHQWNQIISPDLNWEDLLHSHFPLNRFSEKSDNFQKVYNDTARRELNLLKRIFSLKTIWKGTSNLIHSRSLAIFDETLFYDFDESEYIRIVDLNNTKLFAALVRHTGTVRALSAGERRLCVCSSDPPIKIWDTKTETCTDIIQNQITDVITVAVSGEKVFYANKTMIKVYDLIKKTHIDTLDINKLDKGIKEVSGNIVVYEDTLFLIPSESREIKMMDLITKNFIGTFVGDEENVSAIAIDGRWQKLFSRSWDTSVIKAWDIGTKKCIATFKGEVKEGLSLVASNGELFYTECDGVTCMDFKALHSEIFRELADMLDSGSQDFVKQAMERFLRMPKGERNIICAKLYEILKKSTPIQNDELEWAEDAFHDRNGQSSTPSQKSEAIRNAYRE